VARSPPTNTGSTISQGGVPSQTRPPTRHQRTWGGSSVRTMVTRNPNSTYVRSAAALVLLYRTGELAQPAQQPAHQNLLVEPPLAWQPGHRLRRITARIPSLKMDLSATAVRPVQVLVVATARKSTPLHLYTFSDFPKFPKKHWLSLTHLKGIVSKY
jgi:hypothetical protein